MDAKTVAKLRKKISSPNYYVKQYQKWRKLNEELKDFDRFKCNDFFVGWEVAKKNTEIYNLKYDRYTAQLDWYWRKCKENGLLDKIPMYDNGYY